MKFLLFLILLIPYISSAQIDKMSVNKKAGGSEEIQLYSNQKVTFMDVTDNDVMYVKKNDGTTDVYKLSDLIAIVFDGIGVGVDDGIAKLFKLENYPNPFKESTNFSYSLAQSSNVGICIFDYTGNPVKAIANELQEPGDYNSAWDGTNSEGIRVSSGVYYYQLKVDNVISTKQLILIK